MSINYDEIINRTHVCILKRVANSNKLFVELIELKFPFDSSMAELKIMSDNNNRDVFELEQFVTSGSMSCLVKAFNYCYQLSEAHSYMELFKATDYTVYKEKLAAFDGQIQAENDPEELKLLEKTKESYCTHLRTEFYNTMNRRRNAYMLAQAYEECRKDSDILAFSHRCVGYNYPEFKLGDDFTVIYKSNFGYGMSSYFYANIRYKGIDILPYSDLIKYRYADTSEIIRYTRVYPLYHSSWKFTMDFTADTYNHSITSPETFVEKFIMNECLEMVKGLELLQYKDSKSTYTISDTPFNNQRYTITDLELINFKGERISGALSLLKKITELKGISTQVDGYISRIMNCNRNVHPQLKKEVRILETQIESINNQIEIIMPKWTRLNDDMEIYTNKINQINKEEKEKQPNLDDYTLKSLVNTLIKEKYPKFEETQNEFNLVNAQYNSLNSSLYKNRNWKMRFENYIEIIERHFDTAGISLVA